VIDPVNRVAKVRVEIGNPGSKLKPEMFVTGLVNANLRELQDKLVIPRSAVLWTGKRSVVYVKQPDSEEPVFKIREVELGPQLGNSYVVLDGLADGEEIVTQSAFSVDAAAQLEGKPSMMNPSGGKKASSMPGMVMPGDDNSGGSAPANAKPTDNNDMSGMDMGSGSGAAKMEHQTIKVSGNCDQCKQRIETAAKSVSGVILADWNTETKMLHVQFDGAKTNLDDIQKAVAKAGHDTEKYKASDAAYKALPECCKYRK
jgi:Cu(I)/Ag(I) efflux system membrane fusion protein